jgi:hypothetical protein
VKTLGLEKSPLLHFIDWKLFSRRKEFKLGLAYPVYGCCKSRVATFLCKNLYREAKKEILGICKNKLQLY